MSRVMQRIGLVHRPIAQVVVCTAVTWLPLLVLSSARGLAVGEAVAITFLEDYAAYGRLLVALPALLLAEAPIGRRTGQVTDQFVSSRFILDREMPALKDAVGDATRRRESVLPEIVILAIVYAVMAFRVRMVLSEPLTTWYRAHGSVTPAGWYYAFVSLPVFQFLLLRWVWRLMIWAALLWRISRLDLQLLPIHPDRMGGLGFLGLAQIPFGIVGFAGGAVVSSYVANNMIHRGVTLAASSVTIVGYVVLAVLLILAPVLAFTGRLIRLRAYGILRYGDVGDEYVRLFDQKWVKGVNPEGEIILGSSDIQSLADLRNSFSIVQDMSVIAADRKTITVITAAAAIPMVPLLFIALPFAEIIAGVLGIPVR